MKDASFMSSIEEAVRFLHFGRNDIKKIEDDSKTAGDGV